jgi:hypothetical protein
MNLLDAYVTKIISKPFKDYGKWWVKVEYYCYSINSQTQLFFDTKEEAEKVEIGYKFLT